MASVFDRFVLRFMCRTPPHMDTLVSSASTSSFEREQEQGRQIFLLEPWHCTHNIYRRFYTYTSNMKKFHIYIYIDIERDGNVCMHHAWSGQLPCAVLNLWVSNGMQVGLSNDGCGTALRGAGLILIHSISIFLFSSTASSSPSPTHISIDAPSV